MANKTILEIENLVTSFRIGDEYYAAVDGVSLDVKENEVFAIVGESGSGKSALALSILRLHNEHYTRIRGKVTFEGHDLLALKSTELNEVRGGGIGMIFQDPLSALNPLMEIGKQIEENLLYHTSLNANDRKLRAIELLTEVGIVNPELTYAQYPHELSGGMRQRAMIAIALACKPSIIIADEPTTALDVTIQAQILSLLKDLQKERQAGIILITHDLGVVAEMADKVAVMYAGQIVELASVDELFNNPQHPYTKSLLASTPNPKKLDTRLEVIKGIVPSLVKLPREGCRFSPRIPWIDEQEHEHDPQLREISPDHFVRCTCYKNFHHEAKKKIISDEFATQFNMSKFADEDIDYILNVENLKVYFPIKGGILGRTQSYVKAVDDVSFTIEPGKTYGLVGESGSGKSTTGKAILGLAKLRDGRISYNNSDITRYIGKNRSAYRKEVQMIFQDAYSSLNPKKRILDIIAEPLRNFEHNTHAEERKKIDELLSIVGMPSETALKYPHQFSGGQRQRICIARAIALRPKLIVCDEPVSALDLSVQAQVLNYLKDIQEQFGIAYLFISHDLGVVKYMCENIAIMHKGRFVEQGSRDDIYNNSQHIYTKRLIAAIPEMNPRLRDENELVRKAVADEYDKNFFDYYTVDSKVYDLKKLTDSHLVALP